MKSAVRTTLAVLAASSLLLFSAPPAEAGVRKSTSKDIYTGGSLALRGTMWFTFDDRDSVSDIDLSITDYKCDGRGGHVRAQFLIREWYGGPTYWTKSAILWSGGCNKTRYDNNNSFPPAGFPVRDVFSARVVVCFDQAGCFDGPTVDNPYN